MNFLKIDPAWRKRLLALGMLGALCLQAGAAPAEKPAAPQVQPTLPGQLQSPANPPATTPAAPPEADNGAALPPPSSAAQNLYSAAKADLLQLRMLLKNGRSQSTVGSGFLVGTSNLVLTNYHVVSQMALDGRVHGRVHRHRRQYRPGGTDGGRRAARPGGGARQPQRQRLLQGARAGRQIAPGPAA